MGLGHTHTPPPGGSHPCVMHDASEIVSALDFGVPQTLCLGGTLRSGFRSMG
jgi:hypothetical protein